MSKYQFTRREALKAGAAVLPLAAASRAFSKQGADEKAGVVIGMATTGFRTFTNRKLAEELAKRNVRTIQLFLTQSDSNYWRYNNRNDLSDLTAWWLPAVHAPPPIRVIENPSHTAFSAFSGRWSRQEDPIPAA